MNPVNPEVMALLFESQSRQIRAESTMSWGVVNTLNSQASAYNHNTSRCLAVFVREAAETLKAADQIKVTDSLEGVTHSMKAFVFSEQELLELAHKLYSAGVLRTNKVPF